MLVAPTVAPLLRVALFDGLKPLQITELARNAERITFRGNDAIVREGEIGSAAFLIVRGLAKRISAAHRDAEPERVEPGALIGEMAMLIGDYEYRSTIIAGGPVRALRIRRGVLHAQMAADPSLADHFVQKLAGRLSGIAARLRRIDSTLAAAARPR